MIIRARIVVTMEGPPIENGAAAIEANRITDVGRFDDIKARNTGEVVDLGEQALLPGLINAHCHLDYTCLRGKIPRQDSFASWIQAIIEEKKKLSPEDYVASINEGFQEAQRFGTTSIANFTAFPELISRIETPIRTWWFAELIDLGVVSEGMAERAFQLLRPARNRGLAPHAPFTASPGLYRSCEEVARREGILLSTHLAESREEQEMFSESQGKLFDFLSRAGRDHSDLTRVTPIEHLAEICPLDDRWLLVHVNELSMDDLEVLLRAEAQPHIVHCPRSHEYFRHSAFKYGKLRTLGFNVCLGTDSLASNESLSLFDEMRALQRRKRRVSPRAIVEMVTINAARALHQEDNLGRIHPGLEADLIALPCASAATAFEEIVAFDQPIGWLMVGGRRLSA